VAKFLQSFPTEKVHIAAFNTHGREIRVKHPSTKGVEMAFEGLNAGGGTDYGSGVRALQAHKPKEDEDVLFIFVGDEEAREFSQAVRASGLNPLAFGFLKTVPFGGAAGWRFRTYGPDNSTAVRDTAANLGIPCFLIDERTFEDPYAITRTVRALVAATPVGEVQRQRARPRVTLVDQILQTELLKKPAWA
jgi:hypothetical protein